MRPLSELAREELTHFELMLGVLEKRGVAFRRLEPSRYAARLVGVCRKAEPFRLMDTLLCCAMIEARSCERIGILGRVLQEQEPDWLRFIVPYLKAKLGITVPIWTSLFAFSPKKK